MEDKLINFLLIVKIAPIIVITHKVVLFAKTIPSVNNTSFNNDNNANNTKKDPNTKFINLNIISLISKLL